jgi:hypothetical protein
MMEDESRESMDAPATQEKLRILKEFMAKWVNLPGQRTKQWYLDRIFSIGASELGTLLGAMIGTDVNPYQTVRDLVANKVGLLEITDRRAMNWGNVLELVVTHYIEIVFGCKIEEMGSIPTVRMVGQRSSPDGVGVVPCLDNAIVSFEFKAPLNRIPKGYVPAYYRPQVLACLCAVEPSTLGIFADTVIRRCSLAQWAFDSPDYDYVYHREIEFGDPLALTTIYFYPTPPIEPEAKTVDASTKDGALTPEQDASTSDSVIIHPPIEANVDEVSAQLVRVNIDESATAEKKDERINLGECPPSVFDDVFSKTAEKKLYRVVYGKIHTSGAPMIEDELAQHPNAFAYLPLKIMKCCICPVAKEPDYVLQYQPLIDKIISVVKTILDAPEADRPDVFNRECNAAGWTNSKAKKRVPTVRPAADEATA